MARGYSSKDLNSEKRVVQRNSFAYFGTNATMVAMKGNGSLILPEGVILPGCFKGVEFNWK
jgi:hypothetical protein